MNVDKIKAIIFDLDGTICDTVPAITEAVNMTLDELNLPHYDEKTVSTFLNYGPRHIWEMALPEEIKKIDGAIDNALSIYDKKYALTYFHTNKAYDGLKDVIFSLSKKYKIAVLSNKQDEYVKGIVNGIFEDGIILDAKGTLNGIPAKPGNTIAHLLCESIGVKPEDCVLIGDSQVDILTAKNAGFECLSVSWGFVSREKLIENGAKEIVDKPSDLYKYFGVMNFLERKRIAKSYLGKEVDIKIDREVGFVHEKNGKTFTYPINYGYIDGVLGGDFEELDVYLLGSNKPLKEAKCKIIAIIHRENDCEDKLVGSIDGKAYTADEIKKQTDFQEYRYKSYIELA